jgi:hypothetical protein
MNRVALVEDHPRLSALLAKALLNAGIESDVFEQIEPAARAAADNAYAVLIIDRGSRRRWARARAPVASCVDPDTLPDVDRQGCVA